MSEKESKTLDYLYETGVIHGRFQILHHDHLKYLLSGKALCRHLVVGVTNPDPVLTLEDSADPGRSRPEANPLTYYERAVLIRLALVASGIPLDAFTIVPFPVNRPELYRYYVPLDAVFFLSIYDDWGRKKKVLFEKSGLAVCVLRETSIAQKGLSATTVREAMIHNEPWEYLVPASVAEKLKQWNIPARLKESIQDKATLQT